MLVYIQCDDVISSVMTSSTTCSTSWKKFNYNYLIVGSWSGRGFVPFHNLLSLLLSVLCSLASIVCLFIFFSILVKKKHFIFQLNNTVGSSTFWHIVVNYALYPYAYAGCQKIAILIRMHFLNDIIKSRHGFKTAQKFYKFWVLIFIKIFEQFWFNDVI